MFGRREPGRFPVDQPEMPAGVEHNIAAVRVRVAHDELVFLLPGQRLKCTGLPEQGVKSRLVRQEQITQRLNTGRFGMSGVPQRL